MPHVANRHPTTSPRDGEHVVRLNGGQSHLEMPRRARAAQCACRSQPKSNLPKCALQPPRQSGKQHNTIARRAVRGYLRAHSRAPSARGALHAWREEHLPSTQPCNMIHQRRARTACLPRSLYTCPALPPRMLAGRWSSAPSRTTAAPGAMVQARQLSRLAYQLNTRTL